MKYSFALLSFVLFTTISLAQEWCGADKILDQLKASNPGFTEHMHQNMVKASTSKAVQNKAVLYVPVVVHVIHDNGVGNISDDQVHDAMRVLNEDYNRLNSDAGQTRNSSNAPFVSVAGDMKVEFKLAKKDPSGNCTNGIVRVNAPELANSANDDCKYSAFGGSDQWPMDQYLNIWVVNSIAGDGGGMILGYAYLPYWPNGSNYGILIRNDSFGTIGTASGTDGRTLTHEMGHLLGLLHIFDSGWTGDTGCHSNDCNENGDYCCDTPPQTSANWSCSPIWNSCNLVPQNDVFGQDVLDQIENYMSYNSCQNMFSADQVNIMQVNFQEIDFLANMVTPANLIATGVNDVDVLCKAEFDASKTAICLGETVQLFDYSFHGPTSWTWTISPGTNGVDWIFTNTTSASSEQPSVQFLTQGTYTISLSVSDGTDQVSETKTNFIKVMPEAAILPYFEGFESYVSLEDAPGWVVVNPGSNNAFTIDNSVSHSGTKCAKLANFNESGQNRDELISLSVDLSGIDQQSGSVTLSFRYAYRKRYESTDEWLKVFISADCGENWVQRKTIHGDQLSSVVVPTNWSPSGQNDWVTVHMTNVTSNYFTEDFRMRFRFEGEAGNNFFLDDINLYPGAPSNDPVLGINTFDGLNALSIYPNPTDKEFAVSFTIPNNESVQVYIMDLNGRILKEQQIMAANGSNVVWMSTEDLASGTYMVRVGKAVLPLLIK